MVGSAKVPPPAPTEGRCATGGLCLCASCQVKLGQEGGSCQEVNQAAKRAPPPTRWMPCSKLHLLSVTMCMLPSEAWAAWWELSQEGRCHATSISCYRVSSVDAVLSMTRIPASMSAALQTRSTSTSDISQDAFCAYHVVDTDSGNRARLLSLPVCLLPSEAWVWWRELPTSHSGTQTKTPNPKKGSRCGK